MDIWAGYLWVVLTYVFLGGSRGAAFANAFQTLVFMGMGMVALSFNRWAVWSRRAVQCE